MTRVLITGGAGFIGAHLARALADAGMRTVLVDNFARGVNDDFLGELTRTGLIDIEHRDLLVPDALDNLGADFDYLVHLAAIVGVAQVQRKPYEVLTQNTLLTGRAIEFAKSQRALKRFVFASTSEVMMGSLRHLQIPLPTPENCPIALPDLETPRTSYMLSKVVGEAMCHYSGLPFTVVRPHNIFGPRMGMAHVVPELAKKVFGMREGDTLTVTSPNHRRAMCYIDDAVRQLYGLMTSEASLGGVFNVGNQHTEVSMLNLAREIVEAVGRRVTVVPGGDAPHSPARRCPDLTRTTAVTGCVPSVSVREGVARTVTWYVETVFEGAKATAT